MKIDDLDYLRNKQKRTPLTVVNQLSKSFEDSMMKIVDIPLLKEKTARIVLLYLSFNDGASQNELVKITQMKGSTVSVAVSKLESLGLVKREQSEHDLRAVRVCLTDKGRKQEQEIEEILREKEEKIMKGISERDMKTTIYVLEQMLDNLAE